MTVYTTLNQISKRAISDDGLEKILLTLDKTEPDDEPLPLVDILDSNGFDDAVWCLRTVEGLEKEIRLLAVACAREVQHLMKDPRSVEALDVAEYYAHGNAMDEELRLARDAALAAHAAVTDDTNIYRAARASALPAAYAAADAACSAHSDYCAAADQARANHASALAAAYQARAVRAARAAAAYAAAVTDDTNIYRDTRFANAVHAAVLAAHQARVAHADQARADQTRADHANHAAHTPAHTVYDIYYKRAGKKQAEIFRRIFG
jgi:hypothetical protein